MQESNKDAKIDQQESNKDVEVSQDDLEEEAGDQATESSGDQAKIYLVDKTALIIGNFIQVQGVEEKIVFFCKNLQNFATSPSPALGCYW